MDDIALLREYVDRNSEVAFAALVTRHVNKVYSVALRHTGNPHQAEEITQAVFVILARKCRHLGKRVILSGWLYQTARLTAMSAIRREIRRAHREQEAHMQAAFNEIESDVWTEIAPLLDAAMAGLNATDRHAVVLRFFDGKSMREVGAALGANEDAAEKRVSRALEKMQRFFFKRGVTSTTANIAETISANSVQAAPVALAKGATASISTLTLIKGALKIMAWTEMKTAVVVGVAALLAVSTATVVVKVSFFPAIKDADFQANYRHFQSLPSGLFVFRPTHFHTPLNGLDYSCETSSPAGEHVTWMMGRNRTFVQFVTRLYNCSSNQVVWAAVMPEGRFDYLSTKLDSKAQERFGEAVRKKVGLELVPTNMPLQMLVVEKAK